MEEVEVGVGVGWWLGLRTDWRLARGWSWAWVRLRFRVRCTGGRDGVAVGC